MSDSQTELREAFWKTGVQLPVGVELERREPVAVSRPGRGGTALFDIVDLITPAATLTLVTAYQVRLLAGHVSKLKARLEALAAQRRERHGDKRRGAFREMVPAIVTDIAKPSVVEACRREGVAIFDQRGTALVSSGGVFVYVEGKGAVERPWRGRIFSGKASRIVRHLLTEVAFEAVVEARPARVFTAACDLSYVYCYGVLTKLEREGFLERRSPRGGFILKRPIDLLRAWIDSGEHTAVAVEGFYAAITSPSALAAGAQKLERSTGVAPVFSLASALEADQVHVGGLPHGIYWPGELSHLVDAFGLKRTTPHNFLVLRPDPIAWTRSGGILPGDTGEKRGGGKGGLSRVALPQLAVDFATLPGRGREQADFLVDVYGKQLPYHLEET